MGFYIETKRKAKSTEEMKISNHTKASDGIKISLKKVAVLPIRPKVYV